MCMKCTLLMRYTVFWIRTIFWKVPTYLLTSPLKSYTIYSHEFQFESKKVLEETRGIKAPSIIYFPCWYLYFCNVLCTKWWNYYTRNTSNTRRATWKRYWVTGSVKVNWWNISMDLQKGVMNICGCVFHSISISCNTMQVSLCLLL